MNRFKKVGAGKSTLINLITDNVKRDKDSGRIAK